MGDSTEYSRAPRQVWSRLSWSVGGFGGGGGGVEGKGQPTSSWFTSSLIPGLSWTGTEARTQAASFPGCHGLGTCVLTVTTTYSRVFS